MVYLQIATAVIGILFGLVQISKESIPLVQKIQSYNTQQSAAQKAAMIAQMQIEWQYRSSDETWKYYSDPSGRYWARVNAQGIREYSENPQYQIANNPTTLR